VKPLCIYHGGCDDGFAAALVVHLAMKGEVELFPAAYGKPAPDVTGREVIIVDFSYKRADMKVLADQAASILMLDHHKSGAMMAFDHFMPGATKGRDFITYIQDRDLWLKKMPGTEEFTMALRSYPQDLAMWETFFNEGPMRLLEEGLGILRYYRQLVEAAKKLAFPATIDGVLVPVCNSTFALASDVAGELAEGKPFAAVFYETPDGYVYSLRSRGEGGADVSAIASKFGGGGHKNAAGFKSTEPVHFNA
jgi:uncharacterized protein